MQHIHLVGIGGSGLSAIAQVLLESGDMVSGSDRQESSLTRHLQAAGAQVFIGHDSQNIVGADLLVRSSAISDENVEVQAARMAGIPVLKRADFLPRLFVDRRLIAVAGTHGKTTTTAMISWMLVALSYDPSYIIGGYSLNLSSNAHAGKGELFVIEADEYDRMFLGLHPHIAVVTNIEHDHPDCFPTAQDFYQAFQAFVDGFPPDAVLVYCADDPGVAQLAKYASSRLHVAAYSILDSTQAYAAVDISVNTTGGCSFKFLRQGIPIIEQVQLQVPGRHNVRNALAVLAVADILNISLDQAARALETYQGTARRFQLRGEFAGITIIDDYAHHPTEIRATLEAARARYPSRPLWAVWQPHTYTRTRTLADEFVGALAQAQHILVTEVYPARESPPADGFSSRQLVQKLIENQRTDISAGSQDFYFAPTLADAHSILLEQLQSGDVVLVFSAGDADWISAELLQSLALKSEIRRE